MKSLSALLAFIVIGMSVTHGQLPKSPVPAETAPLKIGEQKIELPTRDRPLEPTSAAPAKPPEVGQLLPKPDPTVVHDVDQEDLKAFEGKVERRLDQFEIMLKEFTSRIGTMMAPEGGESMLRVMQSVDERLRKLDDRVTAIEDNVTSPRQPPEPGDAGGGEKSLPDAPESRQLSANPFDPAPSQPRPTTSATAPPQSSGGGTSQKHQEDSGTMGPSSQPPRQTPSSVGKDREWTPIEVWLCILLIVFGTIVLGMIMTVITKTTRPWSSTAVIRAFGLVLVITGALLLVAAGYSVQQISPAMGLLGAVAGYLLGSNGNQRPSDKSGSQSEGNVNLPKGGEDPKLKTP